MSAVKVGFADGNVEAFEPGGISGQPTPFRRNAPQKRFNCSVFILHLQQNFSVQLFKGEGFLTVTSLQPLAHKVFFTAASPFLQKYLVCGYSDTHGIRKDTAPRFSCWPNCLTRGIALIYSTQFAYLVTYTAAANKLGNKPANSAMIRHVSLVISLCSVVSTLPIEAVIRVSRHAKSSRVARVGMRASKRVSRVSITQF